MKRDILDETTS